MRLLKLWRLLGRDVRLLMLALKSPQRPRWLLPALLVLGLFALEPANFALPMLGVIDDLILLPLLVRGLVKLSGAERLAATQMPGPIDRLR